MENKPAPQGEFEMVAKTFQGLEETLAQELLALGAHNVEVGQRMVQFEGDLEMLYRANLSCRTALRILKPIAKFTAEDPDELYDRVCDMDWSRYLSPDLTFSVDATVNGSRFTHTKYAAYRVKDAIADWFSRKEGRRPSVRLEEADRQLNVHIFENRVTISLDSSGEPLSKRGYKVENTEAPINEVLAAGIILMTGWRGDVDFMDPMCGSGTFLTEAALIAANINPGIYRKGFAFEKWADFDAGLFEKLYNDDSAERDVHCRITGSDKDPKAVAIAAANIRNARLEDMVSVECMPMSDVHPDTPEGVLVTNPPYGRRLRPGDMDSLWKRLGSDLKQNFAGWHAWIIGMTDEQFAEIGFKPSVKIPLHNGALECSLREYVVFAGRYDDYRAEGRSVRNSGRTDELPDGARRGHHMSDREWGEQTRKYGAPGSGPRKMRDDRRDDRPSKPGFKKDFPKNSRKDSRKDFKRDSGKDFRKDSGRESRKDFRKDGGKPGFGKDFGRREDRPSKSGFKSAKPGFKKEYRSSEAREVSGQGPKLQNYSETKFGTGLMRSRRKSNRGTSVEENDD